MTNLLVGRILFTAFPVRIIQHAQSLPLRGCRRRSRRLRFHRPCRHGRRKGPLPGIKVDANSFNQDDFKTKFELPTNKPQDVILQVGETQDSVMLNWITAPNITGQSVRIYEAGTDADAGQKVEAKSETSEVNLSEGYPSDEAVKQFRTDVAHHKATVTGLKENTKYTYVVGSEADGWSEEHTFDTGSYGDNWNFLFYGDPQLYNTHDLNEETSSWSKTLDKSVGQFPDTSFLLSAGDQANHSALVEHSKFISPDQMRERRVAVNNGNHDNYFKPSYDAMYNHPTQGDENYWFTYNNALIVSLDSNDWQDFDDDAEFVRETIKEHGKDAEWVIVTFHHSLFSQAYHQEDRQIMYWRERMTPVFSEMDVDLVLSGHDHIYTRTYLMDENKPVDFGNPVPKGGTIEKKKGQVQYVTANSSSGSKYYKFFDFKAGKRDESDANTWDFDKTVEEKTARTYTALWNQNNNPDYTSVEVTPEGLKVSTFDVDEGELDSFTLTHAAEETPNDGGKSSSSSSDDNNQQAGSSKAGTAFGILAALLALIGGGLFFAAQQGLLPKEIKDMLPF